MFFNKFHFFICRLFFILNSGNSCLKNECIFPTFRLMVLLLRPSACNMVLYKCSIYSKVVELLLYDILPVKKPLKHSLLLIIVFLAILQCWPIFQVIVKFNSTFKCPLVKLVMLLGHHLKMAVDQIAFMSLAHLLFLAALQGQDITAIGMEMLLSSGHSPIQAFGARLSPATIMMQVQIP